ncbi:MAG TPA: DUF624 domain-containing protein [Anaerolineae bacterium]
MRAFTTAWRAMASYYGELFTLLGINVLWWITGGIFIGLAALLAWSGFVTGSLWVFLVAPLAAIPAGPASAALANVTRPVARELRVNSSFYWEGFRTYWRTALIAGAISMALLVVLLLNLWFYWNRSGVLQLVAFFWLYLVLLWLSAQIYLYPVIVGLKEPTLKNILRTTVVVALANPFYTAVLALLALMLTALSVGLPILLPFAWPSVMLLLGEHSMIVFVERLGGSPQESKEGHTDVDANHIR